MRRNWIALVAAAAVAAHAASETAAWAAAHPAVAAGAILAPDDPVGSRGEGRDAAVPPVTRAEFERLQRELVPRSDAPWRTIPWSVDLLAARAEAERTGRPLFLWAMNGHPLGCT